MSIILPNNIEPAGDQWWNAYIYGVDTGEKVNGKIIYQYTVWQMFPPGTMIPRGHYDALAQKEGLSKTVGIWHFCREMSPETCNWLIRSRAGKVKNQAFLLEDDHGFKVKAYIPPKGHIAKLMAARKTYCTNPSHGRIFQAYRSIKTFLGEL